MNGLQINITRSAPGRRFQIEAFFRHGSDPILVQALDQALRESGIPVGQFNALGGSFIGEFGRLIFNGHNPDFYTSHVVDYRTASSLETTISKFTAVLTMLKERLATEAAGLDEGPTMPAPNPKVFLDLQRATLGVGEKPAFNGELTDQEYFDRKAQLLGHNDMKPMEFGLLLHRMAGALQRTRAATPELYEQYGEALRDNPFLRNVFYREPLDASHLSHPESVNPTGSLSPHAHDADASFNLGASNTDQLSPYNVLPTGAELRFTERDDK